MNDLLKRVHHEASCLAVIGTITLPAELHHELVAEVETLRAELTDARGALAIYSGYLDSFNLSDEQKARQKRALQAVAKLTGETQ